MSVFNHKKEPLARAAGERLRIAKTLELIKKDRINDELQLLDKRHKQLGFLHGKLAQLGEGLHKSMASLRASEKSIKEHVAVERSHLRSALAMLCGIQKIDSMMKQLTSARQKLMHREHHLLVDLDSFVAKNRDALGAGKIVSSVVRQKKLLFDKTLGILQKESSLVFADKHAIQALVEKQRTVVQNLHIALHERATSAKRMAAEYAMVQKKEQSFARQIQDIEKRRARIKAQLERGI
ncbi:MAG TPA: hypothetical protein VJH88_00915 [Candidatus Nanoarchaeia archaeon]|nr:hypothetical protein [Candidatus Nanoarchaeia archaeon]